MCSFRFRQAPTVLSALFCLSTAPRLPCGCRRRCAGFPSTSVPVSISYSFLQVRSSLPSHGVEAASSSCPIRSFQTLTYRGHTNRTPRIKYLVLIQQTFGLLTCRLICAIPPNSASYGLLEEFFSPYQRYKTFNTLAINLLGNIRHSPTVPIIICLLHI